MNVNQVHKQGNNSMCGHYKICIRFVITPALRGSKDNLEGNAPIPDAFLDGCRGCRVIHLVRDYEILFALYIH
jgi:hypothetical protein